MGQPTYDLCVIGGGAAGLVVAAGGAALGALVALVALVEKHQLGGDCLWHGCVPSKALLNSAAVAHTLRTASRAGLASVEPEVDLARVMERARSVILAIEPNDSPERFRKLGVEVVFGAGRFTGPDRFEVAGRVLTARRFVLATGSRAAIPPLPGLDLVPYLSNENVFDLREPVPHLIVVGGGPIGVEMAQAFRRLGSAVDLLEAGPGILPREDADMAALVRQRLETEGVRFHCNSRIASVEGKAGAIKLRIGGEDAEASVEGSQLIHEYVLALSKGMAAADLAGAIHIYPTLAQINRRVAELHLKTKLTPGLRRWMRRLFGLRGEE